MRRAAASRKSRCRGGKRVRDALRHQQHVRRIRVLRLRPVAARSRNAGSCSSSASCSRRRRSGASDSDENTAPYASGVGLAPSAATLSMKMSDCGTRSLRPCRSLGASIGSARVVEVARARVVDREADQPAPLACREDLVAERAVERAPHVLRRIEHVRQRQDPRGGNHVVEHGAVHARDRERADARELERVLLAAELAGVIHAQREPPPNSAASCSLIQPTAATVG